MKRPRIKGRDGWVRKSQLNICAMEHILYFWETALDWSVVQEELQGILWLVTGSITRNTCLSL